MSVDQEAKAIADYWSGHPKPPPGPTTPAAKAAYDQALAEWEYKFGDDGPPDPPPPPTIPGPPTPGAGMPAARAGDQTAHGGTIGPVTTGVAARVLIGYQPAACMGDPHVCPMFTVLKPHVGGVIVKGSATVLIGNKPAARISDATTCSPEPGAIALGEMTVLIGDLGGSGAGAPPPASAPAEQPDTPANDQPERTDPAAQALNEAAALAASALRAAAESGAALCEVCSPDTRKQQSHAAVAEQGQTDPRDTDADQASVDDPAEQRRAQAGFEQRASGVSPPAYDDEAEF